MTLISASRFTVTLASLRLSVPLCMGDHSTWLRTCPYSRRVSLVYIPYTLEKRVDVVMGGSCAFDILLSPLLCNAHTTGRLSLRMMMGGGVLDTATSRIHTITGSEPPIKSLFSYCII